MQCGPIMLKKYTLFIRKFNLVYIIVYDYDISTFKLKKKLNRGSALFLCPTYIFLQQSEYFPLTTVYIIVFVYDISAFNVSYSIKPMKCLLSVPNV